MLKNVLGLVNNGSDIYLESLGIHKYVRIIIIFTLRTSKIIFFLLNKNVIC